MADETDIQKAIDRFKTNQTAYQDFRRYYDGDQDLNFATQKFKNAFGDLFKEFSLNLCPAVVDALRDKLKITGFRVESGEDKIPDQAWKIWQMNRMGSRAGEVHKEAVRCGDAYAIVWVDPQGKPTIYPNRAETCTVFYDDETPGKIIWGAKYWQKVDKGYRLNMYYADRVEKYESPKQEKDKTANIPDANSFALIEVIKNPYGICPVFHFANNADVGAFGRSELKDVLPVQDGLNKSVLDMLVAMEFSSFRQRYATGIELDYDDDGNAKPPFIVGAERLWTSENPDAKFGDFAQSDLEQFLKVKDSFRTDFATVTGTPLYYFMQTGANFPQSGESYRRAETRFVHKVSDRQESFGNVWEDVMTFALGIETSNKDLQLFTEWEDPGKLTEKEELENLIMKQDLGVDDEQILTEAGYGKAEIERMLAAKEAKQQAAVDRFNAGGTGSEI